MFFVLFCGGPLVARCSHLLCQEGGKNHTCGNRPAREYLFCGRKVTVVVMTEFCRRVAENSSFETDQEGASSLALKGSGYRDVLKQHGAAKSMAEIFPDA
ncbi:MAG: hypothetical protein ACJAXZ_002377 [Akkermansiaceae bacterium]